MGPIERAGRAHTTDSLIAATARVHELTVVARNTPDFEGCDVELLNPWRHDVRPSGRHSEES
jgi:predicted nucleic acid-binding protein